MVATWGESGASSKTVRARCSPVVPVRAEDDLRVQADTRPGQSLEAGKDLGGVTRPPKQGVAERRIGGMHGDVERRQPLLDDPREGLLVQIAEGDVVAVQERQPKVVVLHVEAAPHSLGKLVNEAEDTLVGAGGDLTGAGGFELEAEVVTLSDQGQRRADRRALQLYLQDLVARRGTGSR